MTRRVACVCRSAGAALLLGALALGCGGSLPERASPEKARQALETALDAWKKGTSFETLAKGTPPIYFNDPKYKDGRPLSDYAVQDGHEFHGQSVRLSAKLTLAGKDGGATKERAVAYLVDTSPVVVIVPD
jgi:hypothetical protein